MKRKRTDYKILFLAPYPKGIGASQRFRFEQYLSDIAQHYGFKEKTFWNTKGWDILFSDANAGVKVLYLFLAFLRRGLLLFSVPRYDLVFIHREVAHIGPPVFEWIIKFIFRKKIVYDFDDAIWVLNYSEKNKIVKHFKSPWKVKYICKWADVIIVGNTYLSNFAKQYNQSVYVIPTTIDTSYHKPVQVPENKTLTIGWTGTLTTLKHIQIVLPVLRELEKKYDFIFKVICNQNPNFNLKSFEYCEWNKQSEISDLQSFDIGIMPLYDEEWEKGKCGFKGLQYMALEIPTIMSPVGVNTEIVEQNVNGFLASDEKDWYNKLSLLIEDATLRKQLGKAGRQTIESRYSINANRKKYLEIFESCCGT